MLTLLKNWFFAILAIGSAIFGFKAHHATVQEVEFDSLIQMAGPGIPCPDKGKRVLDEVEG
jgi:hypothetical protein